MKTFGKAKHIHFVGIGGIGMSGIAELLLNLGYEVSGSDIKESSVTRRLGALGGRIYAGHRPEHIEGADVVVYSSAVRMDNPEVMEARERAVPVIPRAEMLAELMRLKFGIAVAGAHGKTTTTTMVASILNSGNLDPTVVIGGRLDIWGGSNAKLGQGDILVAESDESDGSFTVLSPTIAVVTNIDREHLDHYGTMEAVRDAFVQFINKIPFYGLAILCLDNKEIQGILPRLRKRSFTYGMTSQAELRARKIERSGMKVSFEAFLRDESLGRVLVGMPGNHNVLNALAAIAVALELDVPFEAVKRGLRDLGGLARRFHVKGERKGILVLDDYGHHPTEIAATLETARDCWPERRLIVVFQPHRYTRTQALYDRFVTVFNDADILVVAPIYPAGETPIEGVDSEWLYHGIKEHGHRDVLLGESDEDILEILDRVSRPGDVILTLGAGNIHRVGEEFLKRE
ncbi:MAG: UDP-N-acetylmuramate--L-alanine ligase [Deltaproteobacteria bacterium]|nr:UDP-N-acetylmuramate--L-alanine ligase [Deltaproteobacteria bacterium]MBW2302459.1 UDP-N-acetylmuramate--L-alanine ligase [Deltaproteobacteria bacterium]